MSFIDPFPEYDRANIPTEPQGLGTETIWFGGGRASMAVAAHGGIERIVYFGHQSLGRKDFFACGARSAYEKILRPYLLVGEKAYALELNRTRFYPGGYRSSLSLPTLGVEVEHDLALTNDAILQTVRVIRNKRALPLRFRISLHEYTRQIPAGRTWGDWKQDRSKHAWTARIVDAAITGEAEPKGPQTTWFGIVADRAMTTRSFHSTRRYFDTVPFKSGSATISALFGFEEPAFRKRVKTLSRAGSKESSRVVEEWSKQAADAPRLSLGQPAVESFFRMAPLALDALMVKDRPGAIRASVSHYWVWAWDTLVHVESHLAMGRNDFVRDTLKLYHDTADERGIGHAFIPDFSYLHMAQPAPAQGLYIYALYIYVAYTGDRKTLRTYYRFAKSIMERALPTRGREGLFEGSSLFPDFPIYQGQTGRDISTFNNGIVYQAARAMEQLAGWMDDVATAQTARQIWRPLEPSFRQRLWDARKGFWVDSVNSKTLAQRGSYCSQSLLNFSPFAGDLLHGRNAACAKFIGENFAYPGGIRMHPTWDAAFNGDGNQMGQHYPVGSDLLYLKTSAKAGRQDLLTQWLGWVEQFWNQNTVPEGTTAEAENEGPRYPDCPGGKQAFSVKAWYMGILNTMAGISFDAGGVTVGPGLDRALTIEGIHFGDRRWTFRATGRGRFISRLRVNGTVLTGSAKIPTDLLKLKTITVEIERSSRPQHKLQLLAADGAELSRLRQGRDDLLVSLKAPGSVYVRFAAVMKPVVLWRGKPVTVDFDRATGEGRFLLSSETASRIAGELDFKL